MQVLLSGLDLRVSEAFHDGLEVCASGQEPTRVGVPEIVEPDLEVDAGASQRGEPVAGPEGFRDSGAWPRCCVEGNSKSSRPSPVRSIRRASRSSKSWLTRKVRNSSSFG